MGSLGHSDLAPGLPPSCSDPQCSPLPIGTGPSNVCSLNFNAIFVPAQIYFQFYFPAFSSKFHSPYMSTCTLRSLPVPARELGKGFPALDLALYVAVFRPHPSPGRKQSMGPKGNPSPLEPTYSFPATLQHPEPQNSLLKQPQSPFPRPVPCREIGSVHTPKASY